MPKYKEKLLNIKFYITELHQNKLVYGAMIYENKFSSVKNFTEQYFRAFFQQAQIVLESHDGNEK